MDGRDLGARLSSKDKGLRARVLGTVRQHVGGGHVNAHAEDLRCLTTESDEVEQGPLGIKLNEQVDVAVRPLVVTGNRSEYSNVVRTVAFRRCKERLATLSNALSRRGSGIHADECGKSVHTRQNLRQNP